MDAKEEQQDDPQDYNNLPQQQPYDTSSFDGSSSSSTDDGTTESWFQITPPNITRVDCGMVGWKRDCLIIVGGSDDQRHCLHSVELYYNHEWTILPKLNVARRQCACAIYKQRYLVVFGGNSNANGRFVDLDSMEILDLEKPVGFVLYEGKLPIPMRNLTAITSRNDDLIYLVGGYSSKLETNEKLGYLDSILEWSMSTMECKVVAQMPECRRLPAVFILQNQHLVIVGGYHPKKGWTNDAYCCNLVPPEGADVTTAFFEWNRLPSLPIAGNSIFAHWSVGNQCHIITNRTYLMLEYGAPKWQHETADHVQGFRGIAVSYALVGYDQEQVWWQLDHPTSTGTITLERVQIDIDNCNKILKKASQAGFWELELLDQAAQAKNRIPILLKLQTLLETIEDLEIRKQTNIRQFAVAQRNGEFNDCRSLAWSIRDVESELQQAYDDLWNVEDEESTCNVKQRRSSIRRSVGDLRKLSQRRVREVEPVNQMSVSSIGIDLFGDELFQESEQQQQEKSTSHKSPVRRKSSLLLKSLLSSRDLKEMIKSSDQSTTGGVF